MDGLAAGSLGVAALALVLSLRHEALLHRNVSLRCYTTDVPGSADYVLVLALSANHGPDALRDVHLYYHRPWRLLPQTCRTEKEPPTLAAPDGDWVIDSTPKRLRITAEDYAGRYRKRRLSNGIKRPRFVGIRTDRGRRYARRIPRKFIQQATRDQG